MADQSEKASSSAKPSRREERAQRILDAAAKLILRWGYQKTTIDDISREAGVAKGTIYLHWKTREDLFGALLKREMIALTEDFSARLTASTATLREVLKYSALALMKRPLLKDALLRDMDALSRIAQRDQARAARAEKFTGFKIYLEFLRAHNLIRTDLSLHAQVYLTGAVFTGFFLVGPLIPEELAIPEEEIAELIAETIHCTLEADRSVSPETLQAASQAFIQYLNRSLAVIQEQFRQEIDP